jgi:hypothetical protein
VKDTFFQPEFITFLGQRPLVPLLLLGPPFFPIILFGSTTLLLMCRCALYQTGHFRHNRVSNSTARNVIGKNVAMDLVNLTSFCDRWKIAFARQKRLKELRM